MGNRYRRLLCTLSVIAPVATTHLHAQTESPFEQSRLVGGILAGEQTQGVTVRATQDGTGTPVAHYVRFNEKSAWVYSVSYGKESWTGVTGPEEISPVAASLKSNDANTCVVLFADGSYYFLNISMNEGESLRLKESDMSGKIQTSDGFPSFRKIVGDALYVLTGSGKIYATWNNGQTWSIDTTGLQGAFVQDIAVDTLHYGWAATQHGVFYQHPDSSIWHKSAAAPDFASAIFVDRRNRVFISSGPDVLVSTNKGTSWETLSDGFTNIYATSFGDDTYGNVYATSNIAVYRLTNLTPPWVVISDSLATFSTLPPSSSIVNAIAGDSVLYVDTDFGIFVSSDTGATWQYDANQPSAVIIQGLVRLPNSYLASTRLGVFRLTDGDTVFSKVYPAQGFQGDIELQSDSAGNVYLRAQVPVSAFASKTMNFISTDQGTTWTPDTAGYATDPYLDYFGITFNYRVDAQGNQFGSVQGGGLFFKPKGGTWRSDTAGLNLQLGGSIGQMSNNHKKGVVYAAKDIGFLEFALYKRALNAASWEPVDISAVGQSTVRLRSDQNGDLLLTTFEGKIFRYNGTSWTEIPKPPYLTGTPVVDQLIADRTGILWASFNDGFTYVPRGVHYTADNGATWTYAGVDSVGIKFLVDVGDSILAVSYIDGVFALMASPALGVPGEGSGAPRSFELLQNYPNPFNAETKIGYRILNKGLVRVAVYDLLGREVALLVYEEQLPGDHTATWNAEGSASGLYFCKLSAGSNVETRRMVLLR